VVSLAIAAVAPRWAAAHDVRGEVALLDVGDRAVDLELTVPAVQLALARHGSIEDLRATPTAELAADARDQVVLRARDGRRFSVEVHGVAITAAPASPDVVFALRFTPPPGASARWFELSDELVLRGVVNGNVYVFVRRDLQGGVLGDAPALAGNLHYQQRRLVVDRTAGSWWSSLAAAFHLGEDHIRGGTDHLMFLLMLLVVAPLTRAGRTWGAPASPRRGVVRTATIATAFTLGHSLTLALGAVAGVTLPARLVETAIAASILVSAIHAWRPVLPGPGTSRLGGLGGEPLVAAGFGLIHGLAFATALAGFGFDRPSLALALVGFNLGVEAMQLAVIAAIVPSLLVLARHPGYRALRTCAAAVAGGAALVWIAERGLGAAPRLSPIIDRAASHGRWLAVALFALAVASLVARRPRRSRWSRAAMPAMPAMPAMSTSAVSTTMSSTFPPENAP